MQVRVLGSGCSAGFPTWNDGSELACRARENDPAVGVRAGAALAVSGDGKRYSLIEAPLHLPATLARTKLFAPRPGTRDAPIDSILLTTADLGASAGALGLASASMSIRMLSPRGVRDALIDREASFRALEPTWTAFPWDRAFPLDRDGILEARFFPMPGPPPDHLRELEPQAGRSRCGVRVTDLRSGTRLVWAPRIARFDSACLAELRSADLRFVDGTCYATDEFQRLRPGFRTQTEIGHAPIDGRDGSLAWLSGMRGQSFYVHLAGTNPACDRESAESQRIRSAQVEIATDGQEFIL